LFDLIKPIEPRFAAAFYKGVRDTLVAENLDQANRIAFGGQRRWRVVTLAGQLIDSSGTMSGGGNHVSRGGMSSKVAAEAIRPEDVRVLEQDSQRLSERLESAVSKLREIDTALEELSRSAPQADMQIQKIGLDIENEKKRINECEKRVRDLK
jgi:structural maintenance of chromosome 4